MILHHPITVALPFAIVFAQAEVSPFSWSQALLVYGPLGLWVLWFIVRDKMDRDERTKERVDLERRHQENLAAQKAVENAFRTNTNSIITAMAATKHMDGAFTDLLERIKEDNRNGGN